MNTANMLRLFMLAAIWGSSFVFMRKAAPVLGPALLIEYRVGFAALFLLAVGLVLKKRLDLAQNWKHYLILGFLNSALPFLLFAYAALSLTASVMSVINATAPMFAALIGALWSRQPISPKKGLGLLLGTVGVALLVGFDAVATKPGAGLALAAALLAAFCYSVASTYSKSAKTVEPFANAHGSMWGATVLVLPAVFFFPAPGVATPDIIGAALALGVMCTGIAYIVYFKLIEDVGATSALTVTFLNPLFGILWGALFLKEVVGWHTIVGAAIVITGTALVTGFSPRFGARGAAPELK
jgi:drug/metabolite transporter (DMT)-like permease